VTVSSDTREEVLAELRDGQKFLCVTHENPDGDALGSLSGMQQVLAACGKDAIAYMDPQEFPLPYEYRFLALDNVVREPPADLEERTIVFLDCGNIERNPAEALKREGMHIVNVDHHHDNTRFGTVNYVRPDASCTAEIVFDLMRGLGGELTQPIAEALYEGIPQGKIALLARALSNVQRFDGGVLTITHLSREDYESANADESYSEGVVDHLRSIEGTAVGGLVRDLLCEHNGDRPRRKVSLRATDDRVDVSRIAREQGGGGHRRAAGFSTDLSYDDLVEFLRSRVQAQL
jgi:phosphoesterase RecJ-like protein